MKKLKDQVLEVILAEAQRNSGAVPAPMHVARLMAKNRTSVSLAYKRLVAEGILAQPYGAKCGYALTAAAERANAIDR